MWATMRSPIWAQAPPFLGHRCAMKGASKDEFTKGLLRLSMQALTGTPPTAAATPEAPAATPTKKRHRPRRTSRSRRKRSSKRSRGRSRRRRSRSPSSCSSSYTYSGESQDYRGLAVPSYAGHYWQGDELPRDCSKYCDMLDKVAMEILHILSSKRYLGTNKLSRWIVMCGRDVQINFQDGL